MLCEACGSENRPGGKFCDQCGAPLWLSCPACGERNRADARFCATCGASMAAAAGATPATPATAATPRPAAERRQVSVLFADLVGFTAFAESRDPEQVRALQERYFEAASEAVRRHGGTVEKFVGDAVMAVWGSPVAHEDDAQRAVRAGLEVVSAVQGLGSGLDARAGVVTAEAAVTLNATNQGMVAGDMVNTAARLQAAAEPGAVLADHQTVQAVLGAIAFEPQPDLELKGKAAAVRAWRALRVVAGGSDLVEPPFVGRTEELRHLKELLHAVDRDRRIRLVSITGPAGIGKSRLVAELGRYVDGLAEPAFWHSGRSPSYGEGLAFWALGEMVRRRTGLAEGDDEATTRARVAATLEELVPKAERAWAESALLALLGVGEAKGSESLFPAWRTFVEHIANRGSVVLVFEDLQWADSGTLEFIEHLLDWSRTYPILIITIARPELLDRRPGWGTARSNSTAMALEPMPDAEMRDLLAGLLPGLPEAQVAAIVGRAEGVPLYAVEMVRALLADGRIERRDGVYVPTAPLDTIPIPASLRSLIASRLDALAPDDRALLQHAAVVGLTFGTDALASVSGHRPADLEPRLTDLVRRELLEIEADPGSPERGQYRFVQSLIQEVAYETLALRERRARHLAAARHLETIGADETAGALASHYLAAYRASEEGAEADAVASQACITLCAAADRAAKLGAHDQAVTNLRHALSLETDPAERGDLFERAATSAQAGALPDAPDLARSAVEAYRDAGDAVGAVRCTALLADILLDTSDVREAADLLRAEADTLGPDEAGTESEALLYAMISRAHMRLDENEEAVVAADRALGIAERRGLERIVAIAIVNKGSAMTQLGRPREAAALLEGSVRLAERGGWLHLALRARLNLGSTLSDDDPVHAAEIHLGAIETARRIGDHAQMANLVSFYGGFAVTSGEPDVWARALELVEEALSLPASPANRIALTSVAMVMAIYRGEDVAEFRERIARDAAATSDRRSLGLRHQMAAEEAAVEGRHAEAIAEGRRAIDLDRFAIGGIGPALILAGLRGGNVDLLRAQAEQRRELPFIGRFSTALWQRMDAALAAAEGRHDEAFALFSASLEGYAAIGARWEWARTALDAAIGLPGDPRVRPWATEARRTFERLGASPFLALLDEVLGSLDLHAANRVAEATHAPTA